MDIKIIENNEFKVTGFKVVSGIDQLVQQVVSSIIRETSALLGVGGGAITVFAEADTSIVKSRIAQAVLKTQSDILTNQASVPSLSINETLRTVKLLSITGGVTNEIVINLLVTAESGESQGATFSQVLG